MSRGFKLDCRWLETDSEPSGGGSDPKDIQSHHGAGLSVPNADKKKTQRLNSSTKHSSEDRFRRAAKRRERIDRKRSPLRGLRTISYASGTIKAIQIRTNSGRLR